MSNLVNEKFLTTKKKGVNLNIEFNSLKFIVNKIFSKKFS